MMMIVLTGVPVWTSRVEDALQELPGERVHYEEPEDYVARLADDNAALILVDGTLEDWAYWTTAPKINPATRRIPVVVVADAETIRHEAAGYGADLVLHPDELEEKLPDFVLAHARVQDPERLEVLECQCQEPLPPLAQAGVEKFNAGEFYKQHDLFEELWMVEEGPVRDLYRAILQVGVAYYQILRGNKPGAYKMLLRSVQWMAPLPDICQGVDVRQLREDAAQVRAALETTENIEAFDRSLLKPVKLVQ